MIGATTGNISGEPGVVVTSSNQPPPTAIKPNNNISAQRAHEDRKIVGGVDTSGGWPTILDRSALVGSGRGRGGHLTSRQIEEVGDARPSLDALWPVPAGGCGRGVARHIRPGAVGRATAPTPESPWCAEYFGADRDGIRPGGAERRHPDPVRVGMEVTRLPVTAWSATAGASDNGRGVYRGRAPCRVGSPRTTPCARIEHGRVRGRSAGGR